MPLTDRQLNRATLARQMLLAREDVAPVDAVRRLVGLQAQEPASPYIALWNRLRGFDAERSGRHRGTSTRPSRSRPSIRSTTTYGIEREARSLLGFVGVRDGAVYGRFGHWWSRLPEGQVRFVRPG